MLPTHGMNRTAKHYMVQNIGGAKVETPGLG